MVQLQCAQKQLKGEDKQFYAGMTEGDASFQIPYVVLTFWKDAS